MYNFFKRLLDIFVSLTSLIILLPVFLPIIIILRFSAEGEVFYFSRAYWNSQFKVSNMEICYHVKKFDEYGYWKYYTSK